jgi:integrase
MGDSVPADITPAMAARLLARVGKKAPTAANDLLRHMRRVFRFAVRRHLIASSPVADFNLSDAGGQESARQRSLSRDELERLFKALRDSPSFGGTNLLTIKLLLALGVRKGELLGAKWSEFDLDGATDLGPVWRLSARRTKTVAPLSIPLAPAVVEWLKALRQVACGSEFVLPKRRRDRRQRALHVGIDTLNAALALVELDDLRLLAGHVSINPGNRYGFLNRIAHPKAPTIVRRGPIRGGLPWLAKEEAQAAQSRFHGRA